MTEHAQEQQQNQEQHETQHGHGAGGKLPPLGLIAVVIFLLLGVYGFLATQGLPQDWTRQTIEAEAGHDDHGDEHHEHHEAATKHPPYYMIAPFALLLLAIAILPLIPATEHWWHSNLHRFYVAAGLGFLTLLYYGFLSDFTLEGHWPGHYYVAADAGAFAKMSVIFLNAIVYEFAPFIILLFSLFTIAGGIRISGNLMASPFVNSVILLIGSLLASFIGTTGAAMLLIRLLLETNQERRYKVHTVVFFIFCVCNCGGCLTPLGDPPLFLGYLRGVDFFWTFNLWVEWAFINLILIGLYFLWDSLWFYPRESKEDKELDAMNKTTIKITGLALNLPLLLGVVAAVAFLSPTKPVPVIGEILFPGNGGHPWYFLREAIQLGLAATSLAFGCRLIRKANEFSFAAILEVAALFFGIFICMQAPLQILNTEGKNVVEIAKQKTGAAEPMLFFWATGSLSAVLDNAPTYVVFFETARSLSPNSEEEIKADLKEDGSPRWIQENGKWRCVDDKRQVMVPVGKGFIEFHLLVAISLGSVFMGAMTYIGNGPNFMIKAVAEQSGVKMPSFFGDMAYSCLLLLPLFIVMTLLFLQPTPSKIAAALHFQGPENA